MVLFCQMDVTGRTEPDPAAMRLAGNVMQYVEGWKAPARRPVYYAGDETLKTGLEKLGISAKELKDAKEEHVLVVGPGGIKTLAAVQAGQVPTARVLVLGLEKKELLTEIPALQIERKEYFSGEVPPQKAGSALAGVSPAEVYDRDAREIDLITAGAEITGGGTLAVSKDGKIAFCQMVPWAFEYEKNFNLKPTYRRTSFLVSRILANLGAQAKTPLLAQFAKPLPASAERADTPNVTWLEAGEKELILPKVWKGLPLGTTEPTVGWEKPGFNDASWRKMSVPGLWENQYADLASMDGVFLYRVSFSVPAWMAGQEVTLVLGAVDDEDWTYVNGEFVGHMGKETNPDDYWQAVRRYTIPKGVLKAGRNVIAVKVNDIKGGGGMKASLMKRRGAGSTRWLDGLYVDKPEHLDDIYRYYRW